MQHGIRDIPEGMPGGGLIEKEGTSRKDMPGSGAGMTRETFQHI